MPKKLLQFAIHLLELGNTMLVILEPGGTAITDKGKQKFRRQQNEWIKLTNLWSAEPANLGKRTVPLEPNASGWSKQVAVVAVVAQVGSAMER